MKQESRSRKAIQNTITGFLGELVSIICGLILPRLILSYYGSAVNGLITSISKYISFISVVNVGISGAARAMLYKPLAENDTKEISRTMATVKKSTDLVSLLIAVFAFILAIVYPLYVNREFDFTFTFLLILIISLSTFAQYFIGFSNQILLFADQKHSVVSMFGVAITAAGTLVSVLIIVSSGSILVVKLAAGIMTVLGMLAMAAFTKRKYKIEKRRAGKEDRLINRRDAVAQGISDYINSNVDVIVLTVSSGLKTVSVYAVYHMVISVTSAFITNVISSFGAAFGNMNARKEYDLMRENIRLYELIVFSLTSVIFSVTAVLIVPFVTLYTVNISDADYVQREFALVLTLAAVFMNFRLPYETVIKAVGHFRQTKPGAYVEAGVNLALSVLLVGRYGLTGVAAGTLVSAAIRSFEYAFYLGKRVIRRSYGYYLGHVFLCLAIVLGFYFSISIQPGTVLQWIGSAMLLTVGSTAVTLVTDLIFFRNDTVLLFRKLKNTIMRN